MSLWCHNDMYWPVWFCVVVGKHMFSFLNDVYFNVARNDNVAVDVIACVIHTEILAWGPLGQRLCLFRLLEKQIPYRALSFLHCAAPNPSAN